MRPAAALYAALVAAFQSAHGLEISLCNRDGERPVQVRGVSGAFCVPQQPCEGFLSVTNDQLLACPRAGQKDVVGNGVLNRDSCCAVVNSDSGALGCVHESATPQTACLLRPRERNPGRVDQKRRRSRTLQTSVTSEVALTVLVSLPAPMNMSVARTLAPGQTTVIPSADPNLALTEAPIRAPVTRTEGPESPPINPEALRIENSPSMQENGVTITQDPIAPTTIKGPILPTSVPFATTDGQGTQALVSSTRNSSFPTQVPPALTPVPNIYDTPIGTLAPMSPSMAATDPIGATQPPVVATMPTSFYETPVTNTTIEFPASPTVTQIPSPPAANDNLVVSTMSPIDTYALPAGAGLTPSFNENITTTVVATDMSDAPTAFPVTALTTTTTVIPRPTDPVTGSASHTTILSPPTASVNLTSLAGSSNLTSDAIILPPVAAMPVFDSGSSSESIAPMSTFSPSQVRLPLETVAPLLEPGTDSERATLTPTAAQPLAPAMPSSDFSADSIPSESSSDSFESIDADERPRRCSLRATDCSSGTITRKPTGSHSTLETSSSGTGSMLARNAGANTADPGVSTNDFLESNEVLQLSPIIDDHGIHPGAPPADGSLAAASNGSIGGSSVVGNTVTYVIVGCAATIAILVGIFYLRPKRINSLVQLSPFEPPSLMDRSGYGEYWHDRSIESEPVAQYDASSTPRKMSASI